MNKAEEWLRKKLPETESLVNGYYETGYDELSKLLTDFANEMCKEQREICQGQIIREGRYTHYNLDELDRIILSAPSPLEGSDE